MPLSGYLFISTTSHTSTPWLSSNFIFASSFRCTFYSGRRHTNEAPLFNFCFSPRLFRSFLLTPQRVYLSLLHTSMAPPHSYSRSHARRLCFGLPLRECSTFKKKRLFEREFVARDWSWAYSLWRFERPCFMVNGCEKPPCDPYWP